MQPGDEAGDPLRRTTYTFDKVGNQLTSTQPKGTLTEDPDDYTTKITYNEIYQRIATEDAAGHRATAGYNDVGDLVEVVDARKAESEDPDDYTSRFRYDLDHRLLETTDATGSSTTSTYDWDGLTTATTDADGNRAELVLDARAALVEARTPHEKNGDDTVFRTTRFEYDEAGNQTRVITPRGVETGGDPEDFASETVYDELNRVKETLTPYDPDDERYNKPDRTTYEYDQVGRPVKVSAPPSEGQSVRNETRYSYFDTGWIRTSTDAFDIKSTYEYNELGQQIQNTLTSAGGSVSRTLNSSFYPSGALKSRSDNGVPVGLQVALVDNSDVNNTATQGTWDEVTAEGSYGFNAQTHAAGSGESRFVWQLNIPQNGDYTVFVRNPKVEGAAKDATYEIKHKDGTEEKTLDQTELPGEWRSLGKYAFEENAGQAVTLTDKATGVVVADAVRLVRDNSGDTDNENKDFSYRYDANGNQTEITDRSPGVEVDRYTLGYDGINQLTKVVEHDGDTVRNTAELTYDANGNTLTTTHDLTWSKLEYDALDRVERITNAASPTAGDQQVTGLEYTSRGELAEQTKPNGNVLTVDYYLDGATKRTSEKKSDGKVVAEHALTYNANGHKLEDVLKVMDADDHGDTVDNTYAYGYDPQDRIAKVTKTGDDEATEEYRHDAAGNVIRQTVDDTTTTHRYDRNRLLTSTEDGASSTYNYDPLGRLDTVSFGGETIQKYRYDGFDRPASITAGRGDAAKTTRMTYDAFDRTVKESQGSGDDAKTTLFTYLGITSLSLREEVTDESVTSFQYASWGQKLTQIKDEEEQDPETTQYAYHPHGDVEALTDKDGNTKATYGYTAYGKNDNAQFTGADKPGSGGEEPYNSYRFNGKRFDSTSGTYDMGFRTYDPGLNRFLTRDMYGGALADMGLTTDPFTGNRYAFAGGNPVSFVEIDGHLFGMSWSDIGHLALDVVGLIPAVGEIADLANCGWYAAEGNYVDAGLSCASAIPFAGYGASAAKAVKYGDEVIDAVDAANDVRRTADNALPPAGAAPRRAPPRPRTRLRRPTPLRLRLRRIRFPHRPRPRRRFRSSPQQRCELQGPQQLHSRHPGPDGRRHHQGDRGHPGRRPGRGLRRRDRRHPVPCGDRHHHRQGRQAPRHTHRRHRRPCRGRHVDRHGHGRPPVLAARRGPLGGCRRPEARPVAEHGQWKLDPDHGRRPLVGEGDRPQPHGRRGPHVLRGGRGQSGPRTQRLRSGRSRRGTAAGGRRGEPVREPRGHDRRPAPAGLERSDPRVLGQPQPQPVLRGQPSARSDQPELPPPGSAGGGRDASPRCHRGPAVHQRQLRLRRMHGRPAHHVAVGRDADGDLPGHGGAIRQLPFLGR